MREKKAERQETMKRSRRTLSAVYLFVCVALVLLPSVRSEYEWSGFVNALGERVDFLCPGNRVVVGLASDFRCSILTWLEGAGVCSCVASVFVLTLQATHHTHTHTHAH